MKFLVAGAEYAAQLDVNEVPDNNTLSMSIESVCVSQAGSKGDIRIKVYTLCHELI